MGTDWIANGGRADVAAWEPVRTHPAVVVVLVRILVSMLGAPEKVSEEGDRYICKSSEG